jgi:hypothetical protein
MNPAEDITDERTLAGLYVFGAVSNALYTHVTFMDEFLKFDTYLQADEEAKERVLKYLLPNYNVYSDQDKLYFIKDGETWSIARHSTDSLTSPLASWTIGFEPEMHWGESQKTIPFGGITVTRNKEGDAWIMEIKEIDGSSIGEGRYEIKKHTNHKLDASMLLNEYSISTMESTTAFIYDHYLTYSPTERVEISFWTSKPFYSKFFRNSRRSYFVEGDSKMQVINSGETATQDDYVAAEINRQRYKFVTIHYRGVTESHSRLLSGDFLD